MNELPLQDVLLDVEATQSSGESNASKLSNDLQSHLAELEEGMDSSQVNAMRSALGQRVSAIQGPPGTGKSFTGSRIAKALFSHTKSRIMVIAYTNHALDQFLEELLDAGIPGSAMVRLGSKSTERTLSLAMPRHHHNIPSDHRGVIGGLKDEQSKLRLDIEEAFREYFSLNVKHSFQPIMEHLEFSTDDRPFYDAFTVPSKDQKWKVVGKRGRAVGPDYLFNRWKEGGSPDMFTRNIPKPKRLEHIWEMTPPLRHEFLMKWKHEMIQEKVENIEALCRKHDSNQQKIDDLYNMGKVELLRSKRIIGCTTTAAAMQQKLICGANPDVILVEEAGEILECHILAAMAPTVEQLILIGDHKQLRPKVKNHGLSVASGDGYDLNMSLFERLILQGFKHTTLSRQHRMHPEISMFPRALTYPDLEDGLRTTDRPAIEGLRDRVIFINHEHPETEQPQIMDKGDAGMKASKQNEFEAVMILRMVRYLAQQGYGTNKMVVLTPYLGQLRLLRKQLEQENDPVLNDLDASALIQAGLMTQAASKVGKKPLRISTIGEMIIQH